MSPRDAQAILGHSNISVTLGIYSEVFDTSVARALSRIDDELQPRPNNPDDGPQAS